MQLIVCLDEQNGMLFNHRRKTKDREVRRRILESLTGNRLWRAVCSKIWSVRPALRWPRWIPAARC